MRHIEPPLAVHVRRDDAWYSGWLQGWRRDDDDWLAYVRYNAGVGMERVEWVGAERVIPADR